MTTYEIEESNPAMGWRKYVRIRARSLAQAMIRAEMLRTEQTTGIRLWAVRWPENTDLAKWQGSRLLAKWDSAGWSAPQ